MNVENFQLNGLTDLLDTAMPCDFLVFGELHGISENALLVKQVIELVAPQKERLILAFEWLLSGQEENELNSYVLGGEFPKSCPPFFLDSDGRFTAEHIVLLETVRTLNKNRAYPIHIVAFDSASDEYEMAMANRLQEIKTKNDAFVIVETGSVHARKRSAQPSFVDILSNRFKVRNVFLKYQKGTAWCEGKPLSVLDSAEQQRGPAGEFDYVIELPKVEAANPAHIDCLGQVLYCTN